MEAKKIEDIENSENSTVITIGVFDGIHHAHSAIFKELLKIGKEKELLPLVLTFYPHPDRILGKAETPLIQTLSQRIKKINEEGVKNVIAVKFDRDFSELSAEGFINFLIEKLKMKGILVGENFRFGKGMEGNIDFLKILAHKKNFEVFSIKIFELDGKRLSSSIIRNLLIEGRVEQVIPMLGRPYSIVGRVVKGLGLGKKLGIPTANILTKNEILPEGVFITKVYLKGKTFPSVTNIGRAPTLKGIDKTVETHIIGLHENIFNEEIEVFFIKKIRDERRFQNVDDLKRRIIEDIEIAKNFFASIQELKKVD